MNGAGEAMRRCRALCVMLALLLAGPSNAGLKEGLEASAAEDYERSYREMLPLSRTALEFVESYPDYKKYTLAPSVFEKQTQR